MEGTNVLFTANPLPGFIVSGWQLNSQSLIFRGGMPSSYSFNITGNTEITVVFAAEPTSIREVNNKQSVVSVYRNPATLSVTVQADEPIVRLVVYSISGEKLIDVNGNLSESQDFDIQSFPTGLYIVKVSTINGVSSAKLLLN